MRIPRHPTPIHRALVAPVKVLTVTKDTVGSYCIPLATCFSPSVYASSSIYGDPGHRSCADNLAEALRSWGVPSHLPDVFNVFLNFGIERLARRGPHVSGSQEQAGRPHRYSGRYSGGDRRAGGDLRLSQRAHRDQRLQPDADWRAGLWTRLIGRTLPAAAHGSVASQHAEIAGAIGPDLASALLLESGAVRQADLVGGADGVGSAARAPGCCGGN